MMLFSEFKKNCVPVCVPALLASLILPVALAAQDSQPDARLRVSTHLVQFGVIVRDANGPVRNLAKDDFVLMDHGRPQAIDVFTAEQTAPAVQPRQPVPANTYSNQSQFDGANPRSVTIILLDNLNTLSSSAPLPHESSPRWLAVHTLVAAQHRLLEFLAKMDPDDRIAIYGLTDKLHVLCDFTCSRDQLLTVVRRYDATSKTPRDTAEPGAFHFDEMDPDDPHHLEGNESVAADVLAEMKNEDRAEATMAALTAITDHVAGIPGRKNLLWLTGDLSVSGKAAASVLVRGNIAAYPVDARGLLPRSPVVDINDIPDEDAYAEGKMGAPLASSRIPVGIRAMEEMADDTGGHSFVNTNDLTGAIRSAVEDFAVTYTLGFYLNPHLLDGTFHKLRVDVKRPGLTVIYPKGYFAFKDEPASQKESRSDFLAAVRSPLNSTAVPLEIKVDRADATALQIFGKVGLKDISLPKNGQTYQGKLDVYTLEQDAAGNVLRQTNQRLNLNLTEQQYQAYLQSGIYFRKALGPSQDATVLRVLVQFVGTPQVGSVIIPLKQKS